MLVSHSIAPRAAVIILATAQPSQAPHCPLNVIIGIIGIIGGFIMLWLPLHLFSLCRRLLGAVYIGGGDGSLIRILLSSMKDLIHHMGINTPPTLITRINTRINTRTTTTTIITTKMGTTRHTN